MAHSKQVIEHYFTSLTRDEQWKDLIDKDMIFTGVRNRTQGAKAYIEATMGFLQLVQTVDILRIVEEKEQVAVVAEYALLSKTQKTMTLPIAELFDVRHGKICSSTIFFDTELFFNFIKS